MSPTVLDRFDFGKMLYGPLIKKTLELLAKEHWLSFEIRNFDRNTDKATWKAISRWLRIVRNEVEKKIDFSNIPLFV